MRIPESELIINADGSVFHLHIRPEQLADRVILVGDPGRVDLFRNVLDREVHYGSSREFRFLTGEKNGKLVTVLSTGIGCDNIDIVMTELDALANIDFNTREVRPEHRSLDIIRVGTCGSLQPDIPIGSFILSHISIGCDGLMNWYADRDSFALPDFEEAFKKHVHWDRHLPDPYFVRGGEKMLNLFSDCTVKGMTVSASGFYGPQGRVVRIPLSMTSMLDDFESFSYGGYRITNFEMEGSAIAGLSSLLGHNAATVCCAIANRHVKSANSDYLPLMKNLVEMVLEKITG